MISFEQEKKRVRNTPGSLRRWFTLWSFDKAAEYMNKYPEAWDSPTKTPRKGIPPGEEYPLSVMKYVAAVCCVVYGKKMDRKYRVKLADLARTLRHFGPENEKLLRVWRTEPRFRETVEKLRSEYAARYVRLLRGGDLTLSERAEVLRELGQYPAELVTKITQHLLEYRSEDRDDLLLTMVSLQVFFDHEDDPVTEILEAHSTPENVEACARELGLSAQTMSLAKLLALADLRKLCDRVSSEYGKAVEGKAELPTEDIRFMMEFVFDLFVKVLSK